MRRLAAHVSNSTLDLPLRKTDNDQDTAFKILLPLGHSSSALRQSNPVPGVTRMRGETYTQQQAHN